MIHVTAHISFTEGTTAHPRQIPAFTLDTSNTDPNILAATARRIVDPMKMFDVALSLNGPDGIEFRTFAPDPDWDKGPRPHAREPGRESRWTNG